MSWCLKWFCCIAPQDGEIEVQDCNDIMIDPDLVFARDDLTDLRPGTSFTIHGHILHTCERFSINLILNTPAKDVALHINPRLPQNYIVRNCKINKSWGTEEVTSALPFILLRGEPFSVQILITESEYYISINGKHFASFRHRLPYEKVTRLDVKGDVSDIRMEQQNVHEYPDRMNNPLDVVDFLKPIEEDAPELNLAIPYYGRLIQPLSNGQTLHIHGRVKLLPHSFYINLQDGISIWPHPTIPFHLNPRFANIGGKHVICRNSWIDGKWGQEERAEINIDFMPGKTFHLTITYCDTAYNVYLNDKFISEYPFRVRVPVDTIYIQGDIHLHKVYVDESQAR